MQINLKVNVRAYTRGEIPTLLSQLENDVGYITDAPDDNIYGRKKGEWVDIDDVITHTQLALTENSGLNLSFNDLTYLIGIRKEEITQLELPETLEDDTTYYVMDLTANNFISGGTAWSSGDNDFVTVSEYNNYLDGGNASSVAEITMYPLNSQGVYDGKFDN